MTDILAPLPIQRFVDNNGNALVGGQLFTYAGGTSTPLATYTDSTGATPNPNPIVLNARGECGIWLPPNTAYKFQLLDAFGNTIWTVDQIVNSQLTTLYGGVDTGSANAYILTFAAPFQAYADGEIIYWIPSNANTGPSTINVNGLGNIAIVNPNGSALVAGQISANLVAAVLIKGGQALLIQGGSIVQLANGTFSAPALNWLANQNSGLFLANATTGEIGVSYGGVQGGNFFVNRGATVTVTVTGVTGTSSVTAGYTLNQNIGTLLVPCFSGTGSGTSFTLSFTQTNLFTYPNYPQWVMVPSAQDNGSNIYAQTASIANSGSPIATSCVITLNKNGNPLGWVATGTRGLGDSAAVTGSYYIPISWVVSGSS